MAAAKAARIHDSIVSLPQQYETAAGERGVMISGGEKQRIALGRRLKDRTTLIIAYRLSAILEADEIIVLDHGHLVERGTYASLLLQDDVTVRRWQLQQRTSQLEAHAVAEANAVAEAQAD